MIREYRPMAAPFVERGLADPSSPNRWGTTFFSGGVMEFWTEPQMASIHKMLNPRSIAIVCATPRMQYGGALLASGPEAKDRGRVVDADPRYDDSMGVMCYPHAMHPTACPRPSGTVARC